MPILSRIFLHILTYLSINAYFAYLHAYFDIFELFNVKIRKNRKNRDRTACRFCFACVQRLETFFSHFHDNFSDVRYENRVTDIVTGFQQQIMSSKVIDS